MPLHGVSRMLDTVYTQLIYDYFTWDEVTFLMRIDSENRYNLFPYLHRSCKFPRKLVAFHENVSNKHDILYNTYRESFKIELYKFYDSMNKRHFKEYREFLNNNYNKNETSK